MQKEKKGNNLGLLALGIQAGGILSHGLFFNKKNKIAASGGGACL